MSILSITFHTVENRIPEWDNYAENELHQLAENLMDVDRYILSEVESDMLSEGKNTNLFLVFATADLRNQFMESEMLNIEERITAKFGQDVMIFPTFLNPKKQRG